MQKVVSYVGTSCPLSAHLFNSISRYSSGHHFRVALIARSRLFQTTGPLAARKSESSTGIWSLSNIPPWNASSGATKLTGSTETTADLGMRISLWSGDITKLALDAIANAANAHLAGGGGVDGAIHRGAGPELNKACLALNGCPTGQAKITPGFRLPSKYIIHCVGPVGEKPKALQSTYQCALELCTKHSLKSIAFPCISTGVYGYPPHAAAEVAISTVLSYLSTHKEIERVVFCVFLPEDYELYKERIPKYLARYSVAGQCTDAT